MKIVPDNNNEKVTPLRGFREQSEDGPEFSVEQRTLVAPGEYRLAFISYKTAVLYGKAPKVGLLFRIVDPGQAFEQEIYRWYNVKRLIGKPGKNGNFQIGAHSDFLREYLTLFPVPAKRLDRMSFSPFRSTVITGRVETITKNSRQQPLPEPMHYSIIRELLRAGA